MPGKQKNTGVVLFSHCNTTKVLLVLILEYDSPKHVATSAKDCARGRAIVIFATTTADDRAIDAVAGEVYERKGRDSAGGAEPRGVGGGVRK